MTNKPDILIFISDQHNAVFTGYSGCGIVDTPNLDRIAAAGTSFSNAYTSYPLCVPARSSFLTGQLPSKTGIMTNGGIIPSDQATFLHSMVNEGYETVLCGRMHFKGPDQRHGFTKRIMGDFTPTQPGVNIERFDREQGELAGSTGLRGCLDERKVGGGNSPVLEYDRAVIKKALEYLQETHVKPQCIVVGTYGPHFTYIAPPELYKYYQERVTPPLGTDILNYQHPLIDFRKREVTADFMLKARAAYLGMITQLDNQIGKVFDAWQQYLKTNERRGLFVYLADHGDTNGDRGIYAKQTFFEGSARIPLIFNGDGIMAGKEIASAASIMDVGPTLIDLVQGIMPPEQDGKSLLEQLEAGKEDPGRYIISEYVEKIDDRLIPGRMVKQGDWKLMSYAGYEGNDLLFNTRKDPQELYNLAEEEEVRLRELREMLNYGWDIAGIIRKNSANRQHHRLINKAAASTDVIEEERWSIPREVTGFPAIQ